jgi:hypothetical protein
MFYPGIGGIEFPCLLVDDPGGIEVGGGEVKQGDDEKASEEHQY